jgi:hypothetical protein
MLRDHSVHSLILRFIMPRTSNAKKKSAARARTGKACKRVACTNIVTISSGSEPSDDEIVEIPALPGLPPPTDYLSDESDNEICHWAGGISCLPLSSSPEKTESSASDSESDEELEGDALVQSLQKEFENEVEILKQVSPYTKITQTVSSKEWKAAEQNRHLGYTGRSDRSCRRRDEKA